MSDELAPVLLDVGRLVWRRWRGGAPTGIDRVCLAYAERFASTADVAVQWRGRRFIVAGADAQRLVGALIEGGPDTRPRLFAALAAAVPRAVGRRPRRDGLYLNVGHTGLDDPGLPDWIARTGLRAVFFVHDLIPIEVPEFCRPGEGERHVRRMTSALRSAAGIITNSHATLDALRRFADERGWPTPPALAAALAADSLPIEAPAASVDRPYFVAVGTIEGRKNHLLLLQLWKRLAEAMGAAAPRLVLVGRRGWEAEGAFALLDRSPVLRDVVIERGACDDRDLAGLLKSARALLMPSFAEGYGMPVAEALRLGVPVVASDLPVFREVAGAIPTLLPAHDAAAWERAVLDLLHHSGERERQRSALRDWRAPDWAGHFAHVDPWLAQLPSRCGTAPPQADVVDGRVTTGRPGSHGLRRPSPRV